MSDFFDNVGMDSYPPAFVLKLKELVRSVSKWIAAQASASIIDASTTMMGVEESRQALADARSLHPEICQQLLDMALSAAAVSLCTAFGLAGLEDYKQDFAMACEPRPGEVTTQLWRRTQDFFWAATRLACADQRHDASAVQKEQRIVDRHARFLSGHRAAGAVRLDSQVTFPSDAARVMPATVVMISTVLESQDATNGARTPYSGSVEGRCTELILKSLEACGNRSWMELLSAMRRQTGSGRQADKQVPTISCSCMLDLDSPFSVLHPQPSGRRKALLVGINYVGMRDLEMHAGHTDAADMQAFLSSRGFEDMRILVDDGVAEAPTRRAIEEGMAWLVTDAAPGDSLLFLYSGHGCTFSSEDGAADEALCPLDFRSAGMIFDDEVFRLLVAPLQEGVQLLCIVDCCQSGTVLHLPYAYSAREQHLASAGEEADVPSMAPNRSYDQGKMLQVIQEHPAMCAAASFWAQELASLSPSHRKGNAASPLSRLSQKGQAWAAQA